MVCRPVELGARDSVGQQYYQILKKLQKRNGSAFVKNTEPFV